MWNGFVREQGWNLQSGFLILEEWRPNPGMIFLAFGHSPSLKLLELFDVEVFLHSRTMS